MSRILRFSALVLGACGTFGPRVEKAEIRPSGETVPVSSEDDAADDPAIWVNTDAPDKSLIFGTDKQLGLYAYNLAGEEVQFLPLPRPNNVDIEQGMTIGSLTGDFGVTSNRGDQTFSILQIGPNGAEEIGRLAAATPEPYGICLGTDPSPVVAITHKTGEVDVYAVRYDGAFSAERIGTGHAPGVQMEGCVFDEAHHALYVGLEPFGIVRFDTRNLASTDEPVVVDRIGGASGLKADIEGLALYKTGRLSGYLLASVQGDNSFAAYDRETGALAGRFKIVDGPVADGVRETDGIDATSADLGPDYPKGIFVAQDGFNDDGLQNFKIVDWRSIERVLTPTE
ncbi:MAG: phytase [Pseudomonadota bacterium]